MTGGDTLAARERRIVRARVEGTISEDEAFAELYALHARSVLAWLTLRAAGDAADLAQDVWTVFHRRWQEWTVHEAHDTEGACPVLGFLFRTSHLILRAHRRVQVRTMAVPVESDVVDRDAAVRVVRHVQFGECLSAARHVCSDEELAVLGAKLAGVAARDIAAAMGLTSSVVDHRFRSAIARTAAHLRARAGEES